MHGLVEVRELVVTGPFFDLMRVPIRASVAVGSTAIVLLEKSLVLGLEVLLEDDAADLPTLFAETLLRAEVRAIERRVMGQLTRPADAGMECLMAGIADVAAVGVEQAASTRRQGDGALASVERHGPNQPLVSQVA